MPKDVSSKHISSKTNQARLEALEKLGEKLKSAQTAQEPETDENASGWALGVNYASAFVGSVVVAGGIGYSIDHFVHTKPWGLMAGICIGFIAGTRSIVQMANTMNAKTAKADLRANED